MILALTKHCVCNWRQNLCGPAHSKPSMDLLLLLQQRWKVRQQMWQPVSKQTKFWTQFFLQGNAKIWHDTTWHWHGHKCFVKIIEIYFGSDACMLIIFKLQMKTLVATERSELTAKWYLSTLCILHFKSLYMPRWKDVVFFCSTEAILVGSLLKPELIM